MAFNMGWIFNVISPPDVHLCCLLFCKYSDAVTSFHNEHHISHHLKNEFCVHIFKRRDFIWKPGFLFSWKFRVGQHKFNGWELLPWKTHFALHSTAIQILTWPLTPTAGPTNPAALSGKSPRKWKYTLSCSTAVHASWLKTQATHGRQTQI